MLRRSAEATEQHETESKNLNIKELRKTAKEIPDGAVILISKKGEEQKLHLVKNTEEGENKTVVFHWGDNPDEEIYLIGLKGEIEAKFKCDISEISFALNKQKDFNEQSVLLKEVKSSKRVGAGHLVDRYTGGLLHDPNLPTWKCRGCGALGNSNRESICVSCGKRKFP